MATYMTGKDIEAMGGVLRAGEPVYVRGDGVHMVKAPPAGLHPEADARLAAATGSGPATVYRIEASVTNGPLFAIVGTLAEIDARLRSGLVGVDVATGAMGKASEWPMVAEKMRTEWARAMAAASGTAATWNGVPAPSGTVMVAGSEEGARINSITVVRGNRTKAHRFDAVTVRSGDKVSAECDAEGKWTARVKGAAPGSYARAQAVDFTGAGATLTDRAESVKAIRDSVTERMRAKESQRTKPAALAAGQVWLCGDTQWILDEQEPKHPSFWNARTSIGQRGLLSVSTVMGMQYLGTREEVAARESAITDRPVYSESICRPVYGVGPDPIGREAGPSARAMRVGAAVAEGMARGVAMGMSRTPLGTMPVLTAESWRDHGTAKDLACVTSARLGAKVAIREDPMRGIVYVSVEGAPARIVDEAIQDVRRFVPSYVAVLPEPVTHSPLAALRAAIDALIAADSGPFAHARAAALRSRAEDPACAQALDPAATLEILRDYERKRGGHRTPNADALDLAGMYIGTRTVATYERERARSDVYARPARRH